MGEISNSIAVALRLALAACVLVFVVGVIFSFYGGLCKFYRTARDFFFSIVILALLVFQRKDCDGVDYEDEL